MGFDYTIVLGKETYIPSPSGSTYNLPQKFETIGETKQLNQIIQQNQQKLWKTETKEKLYQSISIGLETLPVIKYLSETTGVIKLSETANQIISTGTKISNIQTGTRAVGKVKEGDVKGSVWELSGLIPGWGLVKSSVDYFTYKSPSLKPFEKIKNCKWC